MLVINVLFERHGSIVEICTLQTWKIKVKNQGVESR